MCTEALVITDKSRAFCETVGALAKALGVRQKAVSADPFDCCLCNAHWDNLGARLTTMDEGFPFPEYIIDKRTPPTEGQHDE